MTSMYLRVVALSGGLLLATSSLAACSNGSQLPDVEGLSDVEVAGLDQSASAGDCDELWAARDFFEIGFQIGSLSSRAPVRYVDALLTQASCGSPPGAPVTQQIDPPAAVPEAGGCDPNYSGWCVPITGYDLDCKDIRGPVSVIGTDIHGFDRDRDGSGCENG